MSAQDAIDAIAAKQGLTDRSLTPSFHATQLQAVFDETKRPLETGQNLFKQEILTIAGNTLDSIAGTDLTVYTKAKVNVNLSYPNAIYNTGQFTIENGLIQLNKIANARSFEFTIGGKITSDSQDNAALVGIRLVSTAGPLTGASKVYPAGVTSGTSTVECGFTNVGYANIPSGNSVWVEVSKNFIGTLVVKEIIIAVRPIW